VGSRAMTHGRRAATIIIASSPAPSGERSAGFAFVDSIEIRILKFCSSCFRRNQRRRSIRGIDFKLQRHGQPVSVHLSPLTLTDYVPVQASGQKHSTTRAAAYRRIPHVLADSR
jgi:hypothetical protein